MRDDLVEQRDRKQSHLPGREVVGVLLLQRVELHFLFGLLDANRYGYKDRLDQHLA